MSIDLRQFSSALNLGHDGLWHCAGSEAISYPASGNAACLGLEDGSFWFKHRNQCIAAAVRRFPPNGPIFDVGGGNGFVSAGLVSEGFDSILIEPGIEGARAARRRGLKSVACASFASASFRPASLPAIGLFDVVEHIADDGEFLKATLTALVPGGRAYLTVPAHRWLWSSEDVQAGHFRRYTLSSACAALSRAGFRVDFGSYFFRWLPLPILLMRTLPSALGLRRSNSPATYSNEHMTEAGQARTLIERVFSSEVTNISQGRSISFGASVLLVASH